MNGPWRGRVALVAGVMAAFGMPAAAASAPACSRYEIGGLATGMTYKMVQRTMKQDGVSTVIYSAGRGEISAIRYPGAYLEFDQRVDRRGSARLVLVRVPAVLTPAAIDALVERLGPPDDGADGLASGLHEGTAVWVDPGCGVVLTAYRPPASWWAAEGGTVLQAETLELARKGESPATPKLAAILAAKATPEAAPPPPELAEAPPPEPETPPEDVPSAEAPSEDVVAAAPPPEAAAPPSDATGDTSPPVGDGAPTQAPTQATTEAAAPAMIAAVPVAQRQVAKSVAEWDPLPKNAAAGSQPAPTPAPPPIKSLRSKTAPVATESAPHGIRSWHPVETLPQRVFTVAPVYPALAKRQNLTGHVTLAIVVLPDGTVANWPRVVSAVPAGRGFERAAADAVRQWRFQPATRDGQPVQVDITVGVDFK